MSHPNQSDWIAHNNGDDEGKEKWGGAHEKWGGAHVTTGFSVRAGLCWTEQQNLPPRLSFFLHCGHTHAKYMLWPNQNLASSRLAWHPIYFWYIWQPRQAYETAQMVALVVKSAALLTLLLFAACTHFGRGDLMPSLSERHSEKVDQIERVYGPLVLLSGYFSFTQNIQGLSIWEHWLVGCCESHWWSIKWQV